MINKVILQGRLVRDPELKYTQSNIAYCDFTIAWSEKYKEVETKCFLRCKVWRQTAEFVDKYFTKGQEMVIEGKLVTEEWTDNEGQRKSMLSCAPDKVHFCGKMQADAADLKDRQEIDSINTRFAPLETQTNTNESIVISPEELPF